MTGHGNGFPLEVDVFVIGILPHQNDITVDSRIDAGLYGGLIAGNVNDAGNTGYNEKGEENRYRDPIAPGHDTSPFFISYLFKLRKGRKQTPPIWGQKVSDMLHPVRKDHNPAPVV
jgi:hypothetical protein